MAPFAPASALAAILALGLGSPLAFAQSADTSETQSADTSEAAKTDMTETNAMANDEGFDASMTGRWTGGGDVKVKIEQDRPFTVKCDMTVDAASASFKLDGECGALFMKRPIAVTLDRTDEGVSGVYEAKLRTGAAELSGAFDPATLDLEITWGGEVNGDTQARMTIERTTPEELRVQVIDRDPASGEDVVTSDLTLSRETS